MRSWQRKGLLICLCVFFLAEFPAARGAVWAAWGMRSLPLRCEAPEWLGNTVRGSMNAVWRELMDGRIDANYAVSALALVASRLFSGYSVQLAENRTVVLRPERAYHWTVVIVPPLVEERLPEECRGWLADDLALIRPRALALLERVPPEALRWSAESFKAQIDAIVAGAMPGWHASLRVQTEGANAQLEIKLYPQPPLMLALSLETLSATLPQLLADTMSDKTLEYLSPFTGLPVDWLTRHKDQLLDWLSEKQTQNRWLRALRVKSENEINLKTVTKVTTHVDSTTYNLRSWLSAHAGGDARIEAGVHLGRFFALTPKLPAEVYAEAVLKLEDWRADGRLGLRFSPLRHFWLGVEGSTEDESSLWFLMRAEAARSGLYSWLRFSRDDDVQTALGYHLNRYISVELYYDRRHEDRLSLRALSNL